MARGWESKSVESQMEAAEARQAAARKVTQSEEEIRQRRERESLELSRKRVLQDLAAATHPRHRQQLEAALAHLDSRLRAV
jgi:hypothetical protein